MDTHGPLRSLMDEARAVEGCSLEDLTVLNFKNDPFRIDTPANHRNARWLATHLERLIGSTRRIHLRGLHYVLATDKTVKPNGEIYTNTFRDWGWLGEHPFDAARWLGYLPFDRIIDQRNTPPIIEEYQHAEPWPYLSVGIEVEIPEIEDIEPTVGVLDFVGVQPYKLVLVGEKASLHDVLAPIATRFRADLFLPTGEISDTLIYRMAEVCSRDPREAVILYFADCDPAGWQMSISIARKLQAFRVGWFPDLDFQVHRVALTPDQVRDFGLPTSPLKETEKRADKWKAAMGVEQTEIDALAALQPDLLTELAEDAIAPFFDPTLDSRVASARNQWRAEAQAVVDATVDEQLDDLYAEAESKLDELRAEIATLNEALRLDTDAFDLPTPEIPDPVVNGDGGIPLIDSEWSFAEQCQTLKRSKDYSN